MVNNVNIVNTANTVSNNVSIVSNVSIAKKRNHLCQYTELLFSLALNISHKKSFSLVFWYFLL